MAINANGVYVKDNPKNFTLVYEEIEIGEMIGRGSSSVVLHGIHKPSGIPVALKVINMFDKSKREQLIREICLLYDAECPSLISFYGAFYREGAITIALEYMVITHFFFMTDFMSNFNFRMLLSVQHALILCFPVVSGRLGWWELGKCLESGRTAT